MNSFAHSCQKSSLAINELQENHGLYSIKKHRKQWHLFGFD